MPDSATLRGLYFSLPALVLLALAFMWPAPAAAEAEFCGNAQVNNAQKCWGPSQNMETVYGTGVSTGICVGEDSTQGQCSPTGQIAVLTVGRGTHQPWVIGTASALTHVKASAY